MKTHKFTAILTLCLFVASFSVAALFPPSTAQALTKKQQKECQKWEGTYTEQNAQKFEKFKKSECYSGKGGNCTFETFNQEIDESGNRVLRHVITCPVEGGDDGSDTSGDTSAGCADTDTAYIECSDHEGGPIIGMLVVIINFLATGVGIAVVGGIIWGGIVYASSNGDANKVKQAKVIIVNAIVALLLFIFMYALLNYLVPGGLFS